MRVPNPDPATIPPGLIGFLSVSHGSGSGHRPEGLKNDRATNTV